MRRIRNPRILGKAVVAGALLAGCTPQKAPLAERPMPVVTVGQPRPAGAKESGCISMREAVQQIEQECRGAGGIYACLQEKARDLRADVAISTKETVMVVSAGDEVLSVSKMGEMILRHDITLNVIRIDHSGVEFEDESRTYVDRDLADVKEGGLRYLEMPRYRNFRVNFNGTITGDVRIFQEMGLEDFKVGRTGENKAHIRFQEKAYCVEN